MTEQKFIATIEKPNVTGAWSYIVIPFDVEKNFKDNGHVKVIGKINEIPFRTIISPKGDGRYYMIVNKSIQKQARVKEGDTVEVIMKRDTEPRIVEIPESLENELKTSEEARKIFNKLSYSHQKKYVQWIISGKKESTEGVRAKKAIEMLLEGKKIK